MGECPPQIPLHQPLVQEGPTARQELLKLAQAQVEQMVPPRKAWGPRAPGAPQAQREAQQAQERRVGPALLLPPAWWSRGRKRLYLRGQTDAPRRKHRRRCVHDEYVVLSLRSPVSVSTNRSAGHHDWICSTEDSWGEHACSVTLFQHNAGLHC